MIPPKTPNVLRSSQTLKRFRDCPRLATLPYATYGNAHQIKLAAEILSAAPVLAIGVVSVTETIVYGKISRISRISKINSESRR